MEGIRWINIGRVPITKLFMWIFFVCTGLRQLQAAQLPQNFRVAGLFETEHEDLQFIFKYAIEKMNLYKVVGPNRLIVYHVENIVPNDSFEANKEVCRQMKLGIAAVFGPMSKIPSAHVQSICNNFEIPHLEAQWDAREHQDYYSINLYPDYLSLSKAYASLITYLDWKKFTVIYENNDGLIRLQEILKATKGDKFKVTVRKLPSDIRKYISMFKDLKEKNEYKVVVDCDVEKVKSFLHEALKVNMLSEYYHFHFTTLDLGLVDLEEYKYSGANITAMRLIDPTQPAVEKILAEWELLQTKNLSDMSPLTGIPHLKTSTALLYDAVTLLAKALNLVPQTVSTSPISCNKKENWDYGNSLLNYMRYMDFQGLSGRVKFENGKRQEFSLDVVELSQSGLKKIGDWKSDTGINITTSYKEKRLEDLSRLANMTLRVVTVYEEPYLMLKKKGDDSTRKHEGFMVDLLDLISTRLGFNYTVYEVEDRSFGSEVNGSWDGMVGELMKRDPKQRADLAAAGMTITYDREKVVDFTKPFLNLGITILYRKPQKSPPELFSFLSPLHITVWIYIIAAYLCVSFMLFVIARFSPYEWANPHPCNEDSDIVENQFTILNSLWFTIGSLMQQGCEIAPRAISTRMVACIWWFFTLIMISSYTANLAAFLTVERMDSPIESAEDLAMQSRIKYGTRSSGATLNFFKHSGLPTYKKMWAYMQANSKEVLMESSAKGFDRVKNSRDYAFLAESTTIDYQVQRNCDLTMVGGLLDSKGYGIATPKDSPWTEYISNEIIYFQENQMIQKLYTKWWKERNGGNCEVEEKKDASALGVKNVGGVFVVLIGGLAAGLLLACCEFMWKAKKNASIDKQSFCSEISEELRFAVRCFGGNKVTRRSVSKEVVDNGIQFAPLTSIPNSRNTKELYA